MRSNASLIAVMSPWPALSRKLAHDLLQPADGGRLVGTGGWSSSCRIARRINPPALPASVVSSVGVMSSPFSPWVLMDGDFGWMSCRLPLAGGPS
jgi:hypothetical protein